MKNLWTGTEKQLEQGLQLDIVAARPTRQNRKSPAFENPRELLTVNQAAKYLKVSRRTVCTLMSTKQVKFSRIRSSPRLRLQHLDDYLDKRTVVEGTISRRKRRKVS